MDRLPKPALPSGNEAYNQADREDCGDKQKGSRSYMCDDSRGTKKTYHG
jgi:hypothetical protein